jgi:hypothetical protein
LSALLVILFVIGRASFGLKRKKGLDLPLSETCSAVSAGGCPVTKV